MHECYYILHVYTCQYLLIFLKIFTEQWQWQITWAIIFKTYKYHLLYTFVNTYRYITSQNKPPKTGG